MRNPRKAGLYSLLLLGMSVPAAWSQSPASVKRVQVLGSKDAVEIEIEASGKLVPQTRVLTGPDRLVIDFPNTTPSSQVRSQSVNRGQVMDVRVGLFQSKPPMTRVVLDLKTAQSYQVFPNGHTVIIKVTENAAPPPAQDASSGVDYFAPEPATRPGLVNANYTPGSGSAAVETMPQTSLEVTFRNGLLAIKANKASLAEILFAVHQRTNAEVAVSAGADQEKVVVDIAPGPAPEVLARLLNGSQFNFLILSAPNNPQALERVILSPRGHGAVSAQNQSQPYPPPQQYNEPVEHDAPEQAEVPPPQPGPNQPPPGNQPEVKTAPEDNIPD
jgi:AMIN domain